MTDLFSREDLRRLGLRPISGVVPAARVETPAGSSYTLRFLWSLDQTKPLRVNKPRAAKPAAGGVGVGLGIGLTVRKGGLSIGALLHGPKLSKRFV